MSLRNSRLLQLLGILVALLGLLGYWLNRDIKRAVLDDSTRELLNLGEGEFQASFLVAGRDINYTELAGEPEYDEEGNIIGWGRAAQSNSYGTNTDTIFYVNIVGNKVYMIGIPRDIYLEEERSRINAMYFYDGASGLKDKVSELLNLPIDYYAIINIDIFKNVVDAIGGVEVNVPYRMYYQDKAANLLIDLQPGPQRLDGQQAAGFVRFRQTVRGDYDRIDNVKTLAYAMLTRLKELNVRAVGAVPALIDSYFADIESNVSPALISKLLPRLSKLTIDAYTLPTIEVEDRGYLRVEAKEVEQFLAEVYQGQAREITDVPQTQLLITNRSAVPGLEQWVKERLIDLGIPEEQLLTREASKDPAPTRILADAKSWQAAGYYASLFHVGQQQIDRIRAARGINVGLELVLGEDASALAPAQLVALGGN